MCSQLHSFVGQRREGHCFLHQRFPKLFYHHQGIGFRARALARDERPATLGLIVVPRNEPNVEVRNAC